MCECGSSLSHQCLCVNVGIHYYISVHAGVWGFTVILMCMCECGCSLLHQCVCVSVCVFTVTLVCMSEFGGSLSYQCACVNVGVQCHISVHACVWVFTVTLVCMRECESLLCPLFLFPTHSFFFLSIQNATSLSQNNFLLHMQQPVDFHFFFNFFS